ncbi:hypothetical protein ACTHGU_05850 [Chitinophagaceae bacterium MMS25-I14]
MGGVMRKLSIGFVLAIAFSPAMAQQYNAPVAVKDSLKQTTRVIPAVKPKVKKPKPIHTEMSLGVKINTNGWGAYIDKGWVKSQETKQRDMFYNIKYVQLEFNEVKDPREVKTTNDFLPDQSGKPYIFGKINNFYQFNLSYGFRKMIAGKPEPRTVSVHWVYMGGLSIGLLKPYYVNAYLPQDNAPEAIKYSESTRETFLNDEAIVGAAGFSKGLGEIKFVPGLHLKTGLHFDFATSKKTVLAIETGAAADIYTQNIEIMANQKAHPYVFNLYAGFQFGKRW